MDSTYSADSESEVLQDVDRKLTEVEVAGLLLCCLCLSVLAQLRDRDDVRGDCITAIDLVIGFSFTVYVKFLNDLE
jgi:ABC-type Mn2+/Zn2+ transport system permease subunit